MILPIVFVYVASRLFWFVADQPWFESSPVWIGGIVKIGLWVVPTVGLTVLLRRGSWRGAFEDLGLASPAWLGAGLAAAATLPMAVLPAVFPVEVDASSLVAVVLLGPLAEEVLFRGFLFRHLYNRAGWSMPWAVLGSAIVFALAHHRDVDISLIGPGTLTAIGGGCLFAWMTYRWRNLWPAIAMHAGVNAWWDVTPLAAYSLVGSIAHGLALALAVGITLRFTTRRARISDRGAPSLPASPPPR